MPELKKINKHRGLLVIFFKIPLEIIKQVND